MNSYAEYIWQIEKKLSDELYCHNYNSSQKVNYKLSPLSYASEPHVNFLQKYVTGPRLTLFVGLNPGPWGMCQTGVPFGDVNQCCNFLEISGSLTIIVMMITKVDHLVRTCKSTTTWTS